MSAKCGEAQSERSGSAPRRREFSSTCRICRGIETRYGHLSAISVRPGDRITRGQLIGRMGSTGRSTGSHLHYEVRIDGKPVNPIPFMKSTDYLVAMQKSVGSHSMDQVALGGPTGGRR